MNATEKIKDVFSSIKKGKKAVVLGIGNILRGDDAFGPVLAGKLEEALPCPCFDAGITPENYIGKVLKEAPEIIVLIDAAHIRLEPGKIELLEGKEILKSGFSTHDQSPRLFIDQLKSSGARVCMISVQPLVLRIGEGMSNVVSKVIEEVVKIATEA